MKRKYVFFSLLAHRRRLVFAADSRKLKEGFDGTTMSSLIALGFSTSLTILGCRELLRRASGCWREKASAAVVLVEKKNSLSVSLLAAILNTLKQERRTRRASAVCSSCSNYLSDASSRDVYGGGDCSQEENCCTCYSLYSCLVASRLFFDRVHRFVSPLGLFTRAMLVSISSPSLPSHSLMVFSSPRRKQVD